MVISGFTGAGVLIYHSFNAWDESPIKTTVEEQPVTELTLPKVTVCPPKNSITDLNYDLMMTENKTLDNDTRNELTQYATELLYDQLYEKILTNISLLEDNERYYNWYHGYTQITLPYTNDAFGTLSYTLTTSAASGYISTKNFNAEFDADKVEKHIYIDINIRSPQTDNPNVTLHFDVQRIVMKNLMEDEYDETCLSLVYQFGAFYSFNRKHSCISDLDMVTINRSYTPPKEETYTFTHGRSVNMESVRKQPLTLLPGFRFKWYYSGLEAKPSALFANLAETKIFVRCAIHYF